MINLNSINEFIENKDIAVVGASRNPKKFGYIIVKNLKKRNFRVYPVNPLTSEILEEKCYPDISSLPDNIKAVIFVTKPDITYKLVNEAIERGFKHIWLQQGSENPDTIEFVKDRKENIIYGQCILMFIRPSMWIHSVHRFVKKISGNLPE